MAMTCYTDWKFIRAGNYDKAKGLLRYLTYVRQEAQWPYVQCDGASAVAPPLSSMRRD
jgi:hypothetical protein